MRRSSIKSQEGVKMIPAVERICQVPAKEPVSFPKPELETKEMPQLPFCTVDPGLRRLRESISDLHVSPELGAEQLRAFRDFLLQKADAMIVESWVRSELRSLALTDEQTGFYNHRGFLILGRQMLKFARRSGRPVLLFLTGMDSRNSVGGPDKHSVDEALLMKHANVLERTFRESDLLARVEGHEFAVLAMEGAGHDEQNLLLRLRRAAEEECGLIPGSKLPFTIGVSRFSPEHPLSLGELLAVATQKKYEHKDLQTNWLHLQSATAPAAY